jgi:ubiquinone/menaquinone biosynthesis C-methylase UbiE
MAHQHSGKGSGILIDRDRVISLFVKKDDFFLDIGCGPGDYLKTAFKLTKKITGIDIHQESIDKVKRLGFKGILADAAIKIPLSDNSVDSILISNVMHGIVEEKKEQNLIAEIKRVLKKDGLVGIVEFKKKSLIGPPPKIRLTEEELLGIFIKEGFSKISYNNVGAFNYLVIFSKNT